MRSRANSLEDDSQDMAVTGVKKKVVRSTSTKIVTGKQQSLESLFLQFAKDTLWAGSKHIVSLVFSSSNKFIKELVYNKSGIECIDVYEKVVSRITRLPTIRRATFLHELQSRGADYYAWLYMQPIQNEDHKNLLKSLRWERCIGAGAFANVHLMEHRTTETWSVLKLQKKNSFLDLSEKNAHNECNLLREGSHPNVLQLYTHGVIGGRAWLLLEYADEGTLADQINVHQSLQTRFDRKELWRCWTHLFLAIEYLHALKIIHRDVKCENIFVFSTPSICYKLGDFNLSRRFSHSTDLASSYCGTLSFMAPEIIGHDLYSYEADIWSALCVVIASITLRSCNPIHVDTDELINKMSNEATQVHDLVRYLHKINPRMRPSSKNVVDFLISNSPV